MRTRYSRRVDADTYEYHDSKESLDEAVRIEFSEARAGLFGLAGLLIGGVLTYFWLLKHGTDLPKWIRFGLLFVGAGGAAYVLAKLADLIWNVIIAIILISILYGIASLLWKAI